VASLAFKEAMGALAAAMAPLAYGIYVWKTLAGEARPHPLSWLNFGILTGTRYLGAARPGGRPGQLGDGHHRRGLPAALPDELLARRARVSLVRMGVSPRRRDRVRILSVDAR